MYAKENFNPDAVRNELLSLRSQNLENATFEYKQELIARLGVTVIPSEDLKTRRISFRLNLNDGLKKGVENSLGKVTFGGAEEIITVIFTDDFKWVSQGLRSQLLRFQLF